MSCFNLIEQIPRGLVHLTGTTTPFWFCRTDLPMEAASHTLSQPTDLAVTWLPPPIPFDSVLLEDRIKWDLAEEVLIIAPVDRGSPSTAPEGMQDPLSPAPMQEGSPVTNTHPQGHTPPHCFKIG